MATKGGLTVLVDLTISDWHGKGASEYIHWMGKGVSGAHEWTFRHYVQGGSGEASSRQGRVSFYHFNPAGGLGAGSYFQDAMNGSERVIEATADMKQVQMIKDGTLRDTDRLSGYNITPKNTTTPVRIGSRGDSTGFLVGKIVAWRSSTGCSPPAEPRSSPPPPSSSTSRSSSSSRTARRRSARDLYPGPDGVSASTAASASDRRPAAAPRRGCPHPRHRAPGVARRVVRGDHEPVGTGGGSTR